MSVFFAVPFSIISQFSSVLRLLIATVQKLGRTSDHTVTLHIARDTNNTGRNFIVIADPLYLRDKQLTHVSLAHTGNISKVNAYMIALGADVNPNIVIKHRNRHDGITSCDDLIDNHGKACDTAFVSTENLSSYHLRGKVKENKVTATFNVFLHPDDSGIEITPAANLKNEPIEFELGGGHRGKNKDYYYMLVVHVVMK